MTAHAPESAQQGEGASGHKSEVLFFLFFFFCPRGGGGGEDRALAPDKERSLLPEAGALRTKRRLHGLIMQLGCWLSV